MAETQQQNGPAAFGKIKKFDKGGRVIQFAFDIDDITKFTIRNRKIYFKMTELKEETKYGAKYLIREDEYMANYNWEGQNSLWEYLVWDACDTIKEQQKANDDPFAGVENEKPYTPWEITKDTKKDDPAPWTNVDDLFA